MELDPASARALAEAILATLADGAVRSAGRDAADLTPRLLRSCRPPATGVEVSARVRWKAAPVPEPGVRRVVGAGAGRPEDRPAGRAEDSRADRPEGRPGWPARRIAGLTGRRVAGLTGRRVAGLTGRRVGRLTGRRVAGLTGRRVAGLWWVVATGGGVATRSRTHRRRRTAIHARAEPEDVVEDHRHVGDHEADGESRTVPEALRDVVGDDDVDHEERQRTEVGHDQQEQEPPPGRRPSGHLEQDDEVVERDEPGPPRLAGLDEGAVEAERGQHIERDTDEEEHGKATAATRNRIGRCR